MAEIAIHLLGVDCLLFCKIYKFLLHVFMYWKRVSSLRHLLGFEFNGARWNLIHGWHGSVQAQNVASYKHVLLGVVNNSLYICRGVDLLEVWPA